MKITTISNPGAIGFDFDFGSVSLHFYAHRWLSIGVEISSEVCPLLIAFNLSFFTAAIVRNK